MSSMIRAYLFALDPTAEQEAQFRSHCGAQRFAYNWALAQVKANWNQRAAEESYGIAEADRTPWINASAYSLRKSWNQVKDAVAPWWGENSKEAYASGCANLAAALKNRRDGRTRMPRFKSKRSHLSCRFTTGAFGLGRDRRHVQLPRIGQVRTHESTRKLARKVEDGTARVASATLSYQRGRWHVSFTVELPDTLSPTRTGTRVAGVDLGIKELAVLSTGEKIANPRHLDRAQRELRRAQRIMARRDGPDLRSGRTPSNRWRTAQARVTRIHARVAGRRLDAQHKLTTRLVGEFDTIVIEDLHVAGMVRNRRLARRIADAGWGEIRRQLQYKSDAVGVRLVVADRWFASSKTCSGCGTAKTKLMLSERTYTCTVCGLVMDRDHNAARNLAALAGSGTGELLREQPDGTRVRPGSVPGSETATGRPQRGQRHVREDVAHGTELYVS
ncbi:IS607 family element RNA-guided endonuclease TnpB [Prescottella subtropica]|uniref:IS607 family element RNA-guided endonuclease TnpB n=1 Tax=Prescottella subtropica TaxID=2545757 RepID=UPI0010F80339|nr:IS607 family element RNA-guided endonuclease TnpB [Prescottella subtropica]